MGARITRGAGMDIRLEKIAQKSTRQLRRVHAEGAKNLAETAKEMAPYLTGDLEGSIRVQTTIESGQRKTFTVITEGVKYAIYMHENIYELGPESLRKAETSKHMVGRKFMDRAAIWLIHEWGFYRRARAAVRKGKK